METQQRKTVNSNTVLIALIESNPSIEDYIAHLAACSHMRLLFLKKNGMCKYIYTTDLKITSIQRGDIQKQAPHEIKGVIQIDINHPWDSCSLDIKDYKVVIHYYPWIPETRVFLEGTTV